MESGERGREKCQEDSLVSSLDPLKEDGGWHCWREGLEKWAEETMGPALDTSSVGASR